ncbi:unnamed protein product [Amoebophrya sp. A25]|nr:unnamed protein product [Amoebophrya sp. A25]|eukprot:GSA25T00008659001.1
MPTFAPKMLMSRNTTTLMGRAVVMHLVFWGQHFHAVNGVSFTTKDLTIVLEDGGVGKLLKELDDRKKQDEDASTASGSEADSETSPGASASSEEGSDMWSPGDPSTRAASKAESENGDGDSREEAEDATAPAPQPPPRSILKKSGEAEAQNKFNLWQTEAYPREHARKRKITFKDVQQEVHLFHQEKDTKENAYEDPTREPYQYHQEATNANEDPTTREEPHAQAQWPLSDRLAELDRLIDGNLAKKLPWFEDLASKDELKLLKGHLDQVWDKFVSSVDRKKKFFRVILETKNREQVMYKAFQILETKNAQMKKQSTELFEAALAAFYGSRDLRKSKKETSLERETLPLRKEIADLRRPIRKQVEELKSDILDFHTKVGQFQALGLDGVIASQLNAEYERLSIKVTEIKARTQKAMHRLDVYRQRYIEEAFVKPCQLLVDMMTQTWEGFVGALTEGAASPADALTPDANIQLQFKEATERLAAAEKKLQEHFKSTMAITISEAQRSESSSVLTT